MPQVNGRIEYSTSYFWKQKFCRKHMSDGTPHCCSCNKLKGSGVKWLTLSDKRMVCQDCSPTVVHDSSQAQPLMDEVSPCWTLCQRRFYKLLDLAVDAVTCFLLSRCVPALMVQGAPVSCMKQVGDVYGLTQSSRHEHCPKFKQLA